MQVMLLLLTEWRFLTTSSREVVHFAQANQLPDLDRNAVPAI